MLPGPFESDDAYDRELVAQAHPADWNNPPAGHYHQVAIGGGTAGIVSALIAAGLGGKSALIERHLLGGDCLNFGCVPSKALIRSARAAYEVRRVSEFGGKSVDDFELSFATVMERMRRLRARISHHDSARRFQPLGADVFLGSARFTGPKSLVVDDRELTFARCIVATGGRAAVPEIEGLRECGYLTNETVFSLNSLPPRLLVLGGGPIGAELAQAFRRFGSEVHLVQRGERLLPRDDPDAAELVRKQFEKEGIQLHFNATLERVEAAEDGSRRAWLKHGESSDGAKAPGEPLVVDQILIAAGRQPNVEGLGLEAAGIETTSRGLRVDDRLRTTNPRVFAAGDIAGSYQFTHAADAMARMCVQNAFFFGRKKLSGLVIPRATYTDPEVAHVGLTPAEADEQGIAIDSYREEFRDVDRAIVDGADEGFAVVHCRKGKGQIVGGTIVAPHAGEMIGELSLAITNKLKLGAFSNTVYCYPTQIEAMKHIGDQYNKQRLTPWVKRLLQFVLTRRG